MIYIKKSLFKEPLYLEYVNFNISINVYNCHLRFILIIIVIIISYIFNQNVIPLLYIVIT